LFSVLWKLTSSAHWLAERYSELPWYAAVVMEKEFDMAMAQLDMELAPEGIDRVELARQIYADFLEAPRKKIDWKKIIEEDIRENAKVFGRKD